MKNRAAELEDQMRHTFKASREAMLRAHERAESAAERARQLRGNLQQRRGKEGIPGAAEQTISMLRLAAEESARSVHEQERFRAIVSHELRQPLNAALAAASVLELGSTDTPRPRAYSILKQQLLHMSNLLDDLLEMSRLKLQTMAINAVPLDLRTVLRETVDAVEAAADHHELTIEAMLPATEIPINGDAARLQQVFSNLLSNAVRYTPAGGRVTLSADMRTDVVLVSIADTGRGIPADDLSKVFEPFWRGSGGAPKGLGIGLALVLGIVELHGGSVAAASDGEGRGASFTVTLPLVTR